MILQPYVSIYVRYGTVCKIFSSGLSLTFMLLLFITIRLLHVVVYRA